MSSGNWEVRIPVTVLTGVLGAGKTTLLRYILEKPHGYRVAVIQNEFSEEMGMEAPLFTDANGDTIKDVYELPNGCLCCSAKDGLIGMLDVLLEHKNRFDYVLVEATGIADPEAVCEVFWVDEGLGSRVYLDGVLSLVDAYNMSSYLGKRKASHGYPEEGAKSTSLGLEAEAIKQVACADVLILNKVDLVAEADRARAAAMLREINPTARLLESRFAEVPLGEILGLQAFDKDRLAASVLGLPVLEEREEGGHGHAHSHSDGHCNDCEAGKLLGAHGIESVLLQGEAGALYDPNKVRSWLAEVLWEGTAGFVYRCKGLFRGPPEDEEDPPEQTTIVSHALQGVGKIFEIEQAGKATVERSKMLFIGRGLQRDVLAAGLKACLASD
ncbi:COBW domain-containing protein 1 (Cobalamin synthase W domain-containing protein 1) [Durusdinium trenchii]|uniref:COBW domain-containing protein 1 (Cobalamin synthase W domain-containing protein 1) n=1 Tax=Durusdinium trenchii TaxID=1381693 RepID=A0ABP0MQB0_9DINO